MQSIAFIVIKMATLSCSAFNFCNVLDGIISSKKQDIDDLFKLETGSSEFYRLLLIVKI